MAVVGAQLRKAASAPDRPIFSSARGWCTSCPYTARCTSPTHYPARSGNTLWPSSSNSSIHTMQPVRQGRLKQRERTRTPIQSSLSCHSFLRIYGAKHFLSLFDYIRSGACVPQIRCLLTRSSGHPSPPAARQRRLGTSAVIRLKLPQRRCFSNACALPGSRSFLD